MPVPENDTHIHLGPHVRSLGVAGRSSHSLPPHCLSCLFPSSLTNEPLSSLHHHHSSPGYHPLTWMAGMTFRLVPTPLWLPPNLFYSTATVIFSKSNVILSHLSPPASCPILHKTLPSLSIVHRMRSYEDLKILPSLVPATSLQLPLVSLLPLISLFPLLQPQWPCFHE